MKQEIIAVVQVIDTYCRTYMIADLIVNAGVHHKITFKSLVRVTDGVAVINGRKNPVAVTTSNREGPFLICASSKHLGQIGA